jgi:ribosomal protein S18 acetylase RimI-like enzyme
MNHLGYYIENVDSVESLNRIKELGYELTFWKPAITKIIPDSYPIKYVIYWLAHYLRFFSNRDYSAVLIYDNKRLIFYMLLVPRYYKWPFMGQDDLQFIYGVTKPEYRRLGIAKIAMDAAIAHFSKPGRKFWGVIHCDNIPSINWVERVGFKCAGKLQRFSLLGISFLSILKLLDESAARNNYKC